MRARYIAGTGLMLMALLHGAALLSSLSYVAKMNRDATETLLIAAEGLIYTRTTALYDAASAGLGVLAWVSLALFVSRRDRRAWRCCLFLSGGSLLGISALAIFGDGAAILEAILLAIGVGLSTVFSVGGSPRRSAR